MFFINLTKFLFIPNLLKVFIMNRFCIYIYIYIYMHIYIYIYNFNWRIIALQSCIDLYIAHLLKKKIGIQVDPHNSNLYCSRVNCTILTHYSFTGLRRFPHHYLLMFTFS